jgi:hypothetical protein
MSYWFAEPHTLVLGGARIHLRNPLWRDRLGTLAERALDAKSLARTESLLRPPHSLVPPPCLPRAVSRYLVKVSLSKGLVRKQIAPAFIARARIASSGNAVIKMNGTLCPCVSNWACRSTPLMPRIWTSAITHDVSLKWADRRNSSAETNVYTVYPSDLSRLSVAARRDASSSIIEITGGLNTIAYP